MSKRKSKFVPCGKYSKRMVDTFHANESNYSQPLIVVNVPQQDLLLIGPPDLVFGSRLLNAKKYVNPSAFKCRKRVHVRTLRYIGLAFNAEKVQIITRKKKKLVFHWPL